MTPPRPFRIAVPDETLDRIRARVAPREWHEIPDDSGCACGANLVYLKELCAYWVEGFDWRAEEAALNRFAPFTAAAPSAALYLRASGRREPGAIRRHA